MSENGTKTSPFAVSSYSAYGALEQSGILTAFQCSWPSFGQTCVLTHGGAFTVALRPKEATLYTDPSGT